MFDTDWNPQQDLQAQARVHRLGQQHPVLVLRLFIPSTIEEHIIQIAGQKQELAAATIDGMLASSSSCWCSWCLATLLGCAGGFFDGKTDAKARHSFLLDLLKRSADSHESANAVPVSAVQVHLFSTGGDNTSQHAYDCTSRCVPICNGYVAAQTQKQQPMRTTCTPATVLFMQLNALVARNKAEEQQLAGSKVGSATFELAPECVCKRMAAQLVSANTASKKQDEACRRGVRRKLVSLP
jgi:hypothetical protein